MWLTRFTRTVPVLLVVIGCTACNEPPDKEIQQALGAIEAAKAAGAEQYASDELSAAQTALDRAQEAVTVGDYRLALNHALDSRERAQRAAMQAADGMAGARVEADHALTALTSALAVAEAGLESAAASRVSPKLLAGPRGVIEGGKTAVQEARTAFDRADYGRVVKLDSENTPLLNKTVEDLTAARNRRQ